MKYTNRRLIYLIIMASMLALLVLAYRDKPADLQGGYSFTSPDILKDAFSSNKSNLQVTQKGEIIRIIPDDTKGTKHQRFIVRLSSGQTLLIAHNIDIAPRVPGLVRGESIIFHGVYEYNAEGGLIHWTHHDPEGWHPGGWLEYRGIRYR